MADGVTAGERPDDRLVRIYTDWYEARRLPTDYDELDWLVGEVERLTCQWEEMRGLCKAYQELLRMKVSSDKGWERLHIIEEKYGLR